MCWLFTLNRIQEKSQNLCETSSRNLERCRRLVIFYVAFAALIFLCVWPFISFVDPALSQQSDSQSWPPTFDQYSNSRDKPTPDAGRQSTPDLRNTKGVTVRPGTANVEKVETNELPPIGGDTTPDARNSTGVRVERSFQNISGGIWSGMDLRNIEKLLSSISFSTGSIAYNQLLLRLFSDNGDGSTPDGTADQFETVRLETLFRMGRLQNIVKSYRAKSDSNSGPVSKIYFARSLMGLGRVEEVCAETGSIGIRKQNLPVPVLGYLLKLLAICDLRDGKSASAALSLELAREKGIKVDHVLSILQAITDKRKVTHKSVNIISVEDYMFLRLGDWEPDPGQFDKLQPSVLVAAGFDKGLGEDLRLSAIELGVKTGALAPSDLADAYKRKTFSEQQLARPQVSQLRSSLQRALFFQAALAERVPERRVRLIAELLKSAKLSGVYGATTRALDSTIASVSPNLSLLSFSGFAVEATAFLGRTSQAAGWIEVANSVRPSKNEGLDYWLPLLNIGQKSLYLPDRIALNVAMDHALAGRYSSDVLHRLVTVLDALGYDIPIPLWDAASRTQQPGNGFLPETGHLSRLKISAERKETGKTILMGLGALGPEGPQGANIIALGDVIKALRSIGEEPAARQIGFESLFAIWPRRAIH